MYRFLVILHIITSSMFLGVAIITTARSIRGWSKNLAYSRTDKYLRNTFMLLLYLTLIHGIIMYFFIDPSTKSAVDIQHELKRVSLRFWVIEHFYFMTFALILAQIGGVLIKRTSIDKNKFGYASFYYGIATLITIASMTFYFIYS
jgi:hypothetical protein